MKPSAISIPISSNYSFEPLVWSGVFVAGTGAVFSVQNLPGQSLAPLSAITPAIAAAPQVKSSVVLPTPQFGLDAQGLADARETAFGGSLLSRPDYGTFELADAGGAGAERGAGSGLSRSVEAWPAQDLGLAEFTPRASLALPVGMFELADAIDATPDTAAVPLAPQAELAQASPRIVPPGPGVTAPAKASSAAIPPRVEQSHAEAATLAARVAPATPLGLLDPVGAVQAMPDRGIQLALPRVDGAIPNPAPVQAGPGIVAADSALAAVTRTETAVPLAESAGLVSGLSPSTPPGISLDSGIGLTQPAVAAEPAPAPALVDAPRIIPIDFDLGRRSDLGRGLVSQTVRQPAAKVGPAGKVNRLASVAHGAPAKLDRYVDGVLVHSSAVSINGGNVGRLDVHIGDDLAPKVRLSDVLTLVEGQMDSATHAALMASASAQEFVTFSQIRTAGIDVRYEAGADTVAFSAK